MSEVASERPEAFLLAGGQSRRMGRNKALLELDGRPLIGRVIAAVRPLAASVTIVANDAAPYARFGLPVIADRWPGAAALGGIATALAASHSARAFVLACDLPFLSPELLARLRDADPDADVTLFETVAEGPHPLAALYSRRCLAPIVRRIERGELKVIGFFPEVRVHRIDEAAMRAAGLDPAGLGNLNTPEDYQRAGGGARRDDTIPAMGFLTDSIHAGQYPDPATNAVSVPIYQTSTYAHDTLGQHKGWGYARGQNPTREAFERNIAALEKGRHGLAFGSGMAAVHAATSLLSAGDHVVSTAVIYGGTYRLFMTVLARYGLEFSFVDTGDLARVREALRPNTRLVYLETPTNPLMTLTDIAAVARIAHEAGALCAVDNTFLSPYFQRPLELGADIVIHSTTKYLNGHSDSVGGCLVVSDDELQRRLKHYQNSAGAILSPFDSFLILRGLKTLGLRMRQHNDSAIAIARWLQAHPRVLKVNYPGLTSHPQHALARTQQSGFGGMLSFELGSFAAAERLLNRVRVATLAESLGGVESLISHPPTMTHGAIPAEERHKLGIGDGLVRLSVGCEDAEDLIADLAQALAD